MEGDTTAPLGNVHIKSTAVHVGHSLNGERLAGRETLPGQAILVGNRVVLSSPVYLGDAHVSLNREVRDLRQRQAMRELCQLLLLIGTARSLLLSPRALEESVEDDLSLVVSHTNVEGYVVIVASGSGVTEVDRESEGYGRSESMVV
ncbi:hypothetical protein PFISCL1PPCAC_22911 [Pristionchus fissidentatus]|uniref:Uncharacterized protein n=1 Tax=Pristionchus fissidentatus TaxID=1538716 RepID=A0AAV5WPC4_9BILA|nr:hypothetical protein PFISCL1PPCAC_22911 [Pristionchus fissidentatus]